MCRIIGEKNEKDESNEVFATIDKDGYDKWVLNLNITWCTQLIRDGVINRGELANTLVSLGLQGTHQQVRK